MADGGRMQRTIGRVGGTAYQRAGRGAPLLFVHGVGMRSGFWGPQIEAFAGSHDVVAYDVLGHGGSVLPPDGVTLRVYADQLLAVMDGLGLDTASVVGHSMGALVALECALGHPERIERVVAMNAVYCRTSPQRAAVARRAANLDGGHTEEGRRATLARWFGEPVPVDLDGAVRWVERALAEVDPVGYARTYRLFASSDRAHEGRLPELSVPALFTTGEFDPNSTPAMSRAMADAAPQGRAIVLPGERHMMSLVSPASVNAVLRLFLNETAVMLPALGGQRP